MNARLRVRLLRPTPAPTETAFGALLDLLAVLTLIAMYGGAFALLTMLVGAKP